VQLRQSDAAGSLRIAAIAAVLTVFFYYLPSVTFLASILIHGF
jgi:hypothetical protein